MSSHRVFVEKMRLDAIGSGGKLDQEGTLRLRMVGIAGAGLLGCSKLIGGRRDWSRSQAHARNADMRLNS